MKRLSRRTMLKSVLRLGAAAGMGGLGAFLWRRSSGCAFVLGCRGCSYLPDCGEPAAQRYRKAAAGTVWQIDRDACIQCGNCATACVLTPSAVKCVHSFDQCGYCDLCSGYFIHDAAGLDTGGENQLCPVGAIQRRFVEDPYFEYTVDETLCLGCGRCVKACAAFGNASLHLQVRHDRCLQCNDCAIARQCPARAFRRVERA